MRLDPDRMTADGLRARVVLLVVVAIAFLTVALYAGAFALLAAGREVPGEVWLAAGNASGALATLLANSKGREDTGRVEITNDEDSPVPVEAA